MAAVDIEPGLDEFTGEDLGGMFLFAYADYLRDYDQMTSQVDKLVEVANKLGAGAVEAFASDPSQIDMLPAQTDATQAILEPLHQATLLRGLAGEITKKFEGSARDYGFHNPNAEEGIYLPYNQPVAVELLPGKHGRINEGLGRPSDRVSGNLNFGAFQPARFQPGDRTRQAAGMLIVHKETWGGISYRSYRVDGLIDRVDYTAQLKLTLL